MFLLSQRKLEALCRRLGAAPCPQAFAPVRQAGAVKSLWGLFAAVAVLAISLAAGSALRAQQPGPAVGSITQAAKAPAVTTSNARLYVCCTIDTGDPVDLSALRSEMSTAGIPVVAETSAANLLLNVWRDELGFHDALTDAQGGALWSGALPTQSQLVQKISGYVRAHPQSVKPVSRPPQVASAPAYPPPQMMSGSQGTSAPPAPEFSLNANDGQTYSLQSLKGRVVLLFFWATWCPYCRRSVPSVVEISRKFAGSAFTLIGISSDHDAGAWRNYIGEHQMQWPQYLDREGRVSDLFRTAGLPTFILLDKQGGIAFKQSGWGDPLADILAEMVQYLLKGRSLPVESHPTADASLPALAPQPRLIRKVIDPDNISSGPSPILPGASSAASAKPAANLGGAITAPEGVYQPEPAYTKAARKNGVEGTVTLHIIVNEQGNVTDVQQIGAHLGFGLDENAVSTVRTWRFNPATRDGKPIATRIQVEVAFRLAEAP